jgi:hypothetical protein
MRVARSLLDGEGMRRDDNALHCVWWELPSKLLILGDRKSVHDAGTDPSDRSRS